MVEETDYIWWNGEFVPWDDAQVHVLTHTLHYGMGVFEGIRCYETEKGEAAVFRLDDHMRRFKESAHICNMDMPFEQEDLEEAALETLRKNKLRDGYIRPIAFYGYGKMGVDPGDNPVEVAIVTWPWGDYLGEGALENGVSVMTSSLNRHYPNSMMTRAKVSGNYVNSILAKQEAKKQGYHEAILLDTNGYVSEGSGENLFMIRDGDIITTPPTTILKGITRDTAITLAENRDYDVIEQQFSRDDLYVADELFFTGTAAEITPVVEVDDREIGSGKPGPVTKNIQQDYFDLTSGKLGRFESYLRYL